MGRALLLCAALVFSASAANAETTQKSAVATIKTYYSRINTHQYSAAFNMWELDDKGRNSMGQNYYDFKRGFDATKSVKVKIAPPSEIEGAAGSVYITVPVEIIARSKTRNITKFGGEFALRAQANTFAPTDWKIYGAKLNTIIPQR